VSVKVYDHLRHYTRTARNQKVPLTGGTKEYSIGGVRYGSKELEHLLNKRSERRKGGAMKNKPLAVLLVTLLLCIALASAVACSTPVTEYVLTITSTEGGSVTEPGEGRHVYCEEQGLEVALVATPDAGYRFVKWTGDVSTIADVNSAATTIIMNGDYSITANFEPMIPEYDLTISSTKGGLVTNPGEGTRTYKGGTVVNLVAQADAGYGFVNWTGDVGTIADVNSAQTTITMNGDYSIRANFGKVYNLTISSTYGGSVAAPGVGVFPYVEGKVVNLVAVADEGFQFVEWLGDVATVANVTAAVTTITINGDYEIMARFYDPSCGCPVRPGG